MKKKFSKQQITELMAWKPWETVFEDQAISMELRPLIAEVFFEVLRMPEKLDAKSFLNLINKIVPSHVRNIKGLMINGEPVTPEDIIREMNLFKLAGDIVVEITDRTKRIFEKRG